MARHFHARTLVMAKLLSQASSLMDFYLLNVTCQQGITISHFIHILDAKRLAFQAYDRRKKEKALRKAE
jgi:hypothetical protein